jgi:hypothetical protein
LSGTSGGDGVEDHVLLDVGQLLVGGGGVLADAQLVQGRSRFNLVGLADKVGAAASGAFPLPQLLADPALAERDDAGEAVSLFSRHSLNQGFGPGPRWPRSSAADLLLLFGRSDLLPLFGRPAFEVPRGKI